MKDANEGILQQAQKVAYSFNVSRFLVPMLQRGNAYHMGWEYYQFVKIGMISHSIIIYRAG